MKFELVLSISSSLATFELVYKVNISIKFEVHLRGLPSEIWVISTEMSILSSLLVNWSLQIELLNDVAWSEVKVFNNDSCDVDI